MENMRQRVECVHCHRVFKVRTIPSMPVRRHGRKYTWDKDISICDECARVKFPDHYDCLRDWDGGRA